MFLLQQKVLMEKRTVPSILKTIVERESLKGRKKVSTFFHLKFGHVSLDKFASCENYVNLLFCGMFLGSIGFLYVYDIHFGLENTRRVLGRVLRINIFSLIRKMFDKPRTRGEEYGCTC